MKTILLYLFLLISPIVLAQNEQLAQHYFDQGDFEKAQISYQELIKEQPNNWNYFQKLIDCYQQLLQFDLSEKLIQERWNKYKQPTLLVELGYNFQLKKDLVKASNYYNQAIAVIQNNPNDAYGIAAVFERKVLTEYALKAYETAVAANKDMNFNYQMALLYGQLGKTDLMIEKFLDEAFANPQNSIVIQNQLSRFMSEEGDASFNESLRKALLIRAQKNQDLFWNHYLSWFYVQQKEYGKAFIQEKAIYKREQESLSNVLNLAQLTIEDKEVETAISILNFVLENTADLNIRIQAHTYLIQMRIDSATEKEFALVATDLDLRLKEFGLSPYSLSLQLLQAHFIAFYLYKPEQAKVLLKNALELPLNQYQAAAVKMELADVFLFESEFNQALLYYTQVETDLPNDVVGHEASLKAAKTSYFKADFVWALKQFKELKSASSQLIANDALEYFLLINDNTVADSSQTALKRLAQADYLRYQNKNKEALLEYQSILESFKGQEIEAVTLLRMGKLQEKLGDYVSALGHYKTIIDLHSDGIYVDEALYYSAEIYSKPLLDVEKAKYYYEQLIFKHEDSIYFTEARKKYRLLRGDSNL